jgi:preprotein translocase subunit SecE
MDVAANAAVSSPVVEKKVSTGRTKVTVESATRKERGQKSAPAGRKVINTERFDGVRRFTRETVAEIKKVNWPDQQTTRNLTAVVIAVSAVLGVLLGGIDFILLKIFEALP